MNTTQLIEQKVKCTECEIEFTQFSYATQNPQFVKCVFCQAVEFGEMNN